MASSSSSPINWVYDVFPSFSGEDVRLTFLSHFLMELERKLIKAFIDNDIKRGLLLDPELKQAIKESKIAVVIFSKKYASSTWCLNELLEIVQCREERGQIVIPVFYGLDPTHVRKQTGEFGEIFEKTCQNKAEEVKIQWREALTSVANTLGYHSVTWVKEAKLVKEIADDILVKLLLTTPEDSNEFVGLEDHIAKMSELLKFEFDEVRMVGIWGSSGIGKTTIARVLYERLRRHFEGRVFIDKYSISRSMEIYNKGKPNDYNMKLHLQEYLLSKILDKEGIHVDHLGVLRQKLNYRKVLIVIDDLEDRVVLDALAGKADWFGSGSRIIVITKDKRLLEAHGIDHIYEVGLPSIDQALRIFCLYAFRTDSPPDGFMELASEVALRAGNLPLGLEVLGSSLRGMKRDGWMNTMPSLRTTLNGEIQSTLRVSYDGLNNEKDKAIFRRIACIFNGERVKDVKKLLPDSVSDLNDWDVNAGFIKLVDKSLIHVRHDTVEMHLLLQELGKDIVRTKSDEPGQREFLVVFNDICDVLENNTGTEKVLGITLDLDENDELQIDESAFKKMRRLLYLKFRTKKDVRWNLPDGFDYLPSTLRLLSWENYPLSHFPSKFIPKNLVKLQMQESKLEKLWDGVHSLRALKDIDLQRSKSIKTLPDLSGATNLVTLDLCDCSSLEELPSSIQHLNKLEKLILSGCSNLETLPSAINLHSLDRLDLQGCSRLRSFPDISTNISELIICKTGIEKFPSNLRLKKLILLSMTEMKSEKLWESKQPFTLVMNLVSPTLEILNLSDIPSLVELPSSIQNLTKLLYLQITNCINLQTLPTDINLESLGGLDLSGCSRLKTFPDISKSLQYLYLRQTSIEEVPWWIENFYKLKHLGMKGCNKLYSVSLHLSKLRYLDTADFSDCGALVEARLNGSSSAPATATATEINHLRLQAMIEVFSSLLVPDPDRLQKVRLDFFNCVKLDHDSLIQKQTVFFEAMMFSGEEVPSYFTHRTDGDNLILRTSTTQSVLKCKVCAVVDCISIPTEHDFFHIQVDYVFVDRLEDHFASSRQPLIISNLKLGSQLVFFECSFLLNNGAPPLVGLIRLRTSQVHCEDELSKELDLPEPPQNEVKFQLKEWGIQVPPPRH